MQNFKIYLICWLISKLKFPKQRNKKAIYHLRQFLCLTGIDFATFK